jgi:NADH:ubiquinone oxidoreductase subunit 4 (subunit M)
MGICSWLIAIPFLTMLGVVFTPADKWKAIRWISAIGCGIHLVLTAYMTYLYWQEAAPNLDAIGGASLTTLYLVEKVEWFEPLGIQ